MGALAGRVGLVTGGGQGVGRGIALALARRGAAVAITGRTEVRLAAAVGEIETLGIPASAHVCDGNDAAAIAATVAAVADRHGRIDILVNNAQQVPLGRLLDVSDEDFLTGFTSGPLAALRFMRAAYPHLKRSGDGVIFNLATSAAVRWDMAGYGAYAAVKQAMRSLTRAAAAEWGPDGIRVLSIAPHADSPALKQWAEARPDEAEAFRRTIPLRRIGACEADIGAAVAALAGPDFAYLSGATIPLDGGQANFD